MPKTKITKRQLMMSDFEIWQSFRQAKNPYQQITLLAQLNLTSPQEIEKIITEKEREQALSDLEYGKLLKRARPNTPVQSGKSHPRTTLI